MSNEYKRRGGRPLGSEIMVSIVCETYNHQNYIADAIEGFLMQETDFEYEVLIHDDASTDLTPSIIKDYQERYPDIIRPVFQTENQYSKCVHVERIVEACAKGKYIAFCEGDDYWTDAGKLQKQVDYLEQHPECSMCVHAAYRVSQNKTKQRDHVRPSRSSRVFSTEEVIVGGGGLFATDSIVYPAKYRTYRPAFYMNAPVGDYPLAIYLSLLGEVHYIDELMSAYRVDVEGSWTSTALSTNSKRIEICESISRMLSEVDEYTDRLYHDTIETTQKRDMFVCMLECGRISDARKLKSNGVYLALPPKKRIKAFIKLHFYAAARIMIGFRKKLSG